MLDRVALKVRIRGIRHPLVDCVKLLVGCGLYVVSLLGAVKTQLVTCSSGCGSARDVLYISCSCGVLLTTLFLASLYFDVLRRHSCVDLLALVIVRSANILHSVVVRQVDLLLTVSAATSFAHEVI